MDFPIKHGNFRYLKLPEAAGPDPTCRQSESQLSCAEMLLRKFEPWQRKNHPLFTCFMGVRGSPIRRQPHESPYNPRFECLNHVKSQLLLLELTLFAG